MGILQRVNWSGVVVLLLPLKILVFLLFVVGAGSRVGASFDSWVSEFSGMGGEVQPGDDPDRDGMSNVLENFLGTDPSVFSKIRTEVDLEGDEFIFRHPRNPDWVNDVEVTYRWTTDLVRYHL